MFDTTLSFLATSMSRYLFTGQPARRVGNRHPLSAPFGVYRARDGHYALAVLNKKLFDATAAAMDCPSWPAIRVLPAMKPARPTSPHCAPRWRAGARSTMWPMWWRGWKPQAFPQPHLEYRAGPELRADPLARPALRGRGRTPSGPAAADTARAFQRRSAQSGATRAGPGRTHELLLQSWLGRSTDAIAALR
jgi:CoA:oxalate CoA-transferase